ncbi:hypothetical protein RDWZM_003417 [Blomia tropicalis]|uniref:Fibronectin type-III domain-containing protein n=1 Tax=Blomia tropicalis TaxID=40697 RepID=A0A9Q0MFS5_BLOTA|nr:hypothetical protein RDWZM_003417 [Blomia tropicalis]
MLNTSTNNTSPTMTGGTRNPLPGPPHFVDLHVNSGESVSIQFFDGNETILRGPTTIKMISQHSFPPMPMPVQVPPGHMIQQIVDENGTLRHIILSALSASNCNGYTSANQIQQSNSTGASSLNSNTSASSYCCCCYNYCTQTNGPGTTSSSSAVAAATLTPNTSNVNSSSQLSTNPVIQTQMVQNSSGTSGGGGGGGLYPLVTNQYGGRQRRSNRNYQQSSPNSNSSTIGKRSMGNANISYSSQATHHYGPSTLMNGNLPNSTKGNNSINSHRTPYKVDNTIVKTNHYGNNRASNNNLYYEARLQPYVTNNKQQYEPRDCSETKYYMNKPYGQYNHQHEYSTTIAPGMDQIIFNEKYYKEYHYDDTSFTNKPIKLNKSKAPPMLDQFGTRTKADYGYSVRHNRSNLMTTAVSDQDDSHKSSQSDCTVDFMIDDSLLCDQNEKQSKLSMEKQTEKISDNKRHQETYASKCTTTDMNESKLKGDDLPIGPKVIITEVIDCETPLIVEPKETEKEKNPMANGPTSKSSIISNDEITQLESINLVSYSISWNSVRLKWFFTDQTKSNECKRHYLVDMLYGNLNDSPNSRIVYQGHTVNCRVAHLLPTKEYTFRVRTNSDEATYISNLVTITTTEQPPATLSIAKLGGGGRRSKQQLQQQVQLQQQQILHQQHLIDQQHQQMVEAAAAAAGHKMSSTGGNLNLMGQGSSDRPYAIMILVCFTTVALVVAVLLQHLLSTN